MTRALPPRRGLADLLSPPRTAFTPVIHGRVVRRVADVRVAFKLHLLVSIDSAMPHILNMFDAPQPEEHPCIDVPSY